MYPRSVRRAIAAAGAVLAGLIVVCWHRRGGTGLDHWVAVQLTPLAGWGPVSWLGHLTDPWYVVAAAGLLAAAHELNGRRARALALVVPVLAALAVVELILKPGVDARTVGGTWTFPSGNVTGGVALVTTVWWVEVRHARRDLWRTVGMVGLGLVVALSSLALVADRIHFLTDAVGAVCVGIGMPLLILGRRTLRSG